MEQIALNEKINTGDGIERISIIIYIQITENMNKLFFLTAKLPTHKSAGKGVCKYIINSHTSLLIFQLNMQSKQQHGVRIPQKQLLEH